MTKSLMMVQIARFRLGLLVLCGVMSIQTASAVVAVSNSFGSVWGSTGTQFVDTNRAGWVGSSVRIGVGSTDPYFPAPKIGFRTCWLNSILATTNSWLQPPFLTNGVGTIQLVQRTRFTMPGFNTIAFQVSPDGTNDWSTVTNQTYTDYLSGNWGTNYIVLNIYEPTFLRFLKIADNGGDQTEGLDMIVIHYPPTRVNFTNVALVPSPAYSNASFNFTTCIQPQGIISNLTVTNFYRIGTSGPWTEIGMVSNGPNSWITTNSVPGQLPGTTVQYAFNAYFQGPDAMSPTSYPTAGTSAPLAFVVKDYSVSDYNPTSMVVFGALSTNMILISNYTWEAFLESAAPFTDVGIRWQGVANNDSNTTNTWGENDQDDFIFRLEGVAELDGGDVILPGTNSGQFVLIFNETNGAYILNHGYWENFDAWNYTTTSRAGWISTNGVIITDPTRVLRGQSLLLGPGSNVRSPLLEMGIGEIVFSFRNYQANGLPAAALCVQRSATGSDNDADWFTLTNLLNITTTDYVRTAFTVEDRNNRYIRIQNTSTNGWVTLDEIQIHDPYYSCVIVSNLNLSPSSPTATDPVTLSVDIQPVSGASNIQATLYYRLGGETSYSSISLTNTSGFTYTTVTPIPGDLVPDYWGYRVEYYIRCTFTGDQSSITSPVDIPAGGSNNPSFYAIESDIARVTLNNLTQTYNGSNRIVTATTLPTGLVVDITYDGNLVSPVNTGSYVIVGTVNDAIYQGTQTGTLSVAKGDQTIIFPNPGLQFTNSTVILQASASSGLPVIFEVASGPGIITADTQLTFIATGRVSIVATQEGNLNWNPAPQKTNSFNVAKTIALVTLNNLTQTYNGSNRIVTASTVPTGLVVDVTYNGDITPPINTGSYFIIGTVNDAIYQGSQTGTLVVAKGNQTIIFPNPGTQVITNTVVLTAIAGSGLPVSFSVSSGPGIIAGGSNLTFPGTGSVAIVASQGGDSNWNPAAPKTNILVVTKAMASVTLTNLTQMYNGSNRIVTASTIPTGLVVDITYDGNVAAPVNVGSYVVVGTINDNIYQGSQSGILVVIINDTTAFFRIVSSTTTVITALSPDGVLVWSNAAMSDTGCIQWATTLIGVSNWMDFTGYTVTGTLMAWRLFDPIPLPPAGMVLVPAGSNSVTDPDYGAYSLTVESFYMDRYEVTKALWDEVRNWNGGNGYSYDNAGAGKAANHPVHTVSWYDVVKWCNARSQKDGRTPVYYTDAALTQIFKTGSVSGVSAPYIKPSANGYRLPTVVQWEYAARGGVSNRRFPWADIDNIQHARANYYSDSRVSYDTSPTRGYHPTYSTNRVMPYTSRWGVLRRTATGCTIWRVMCGSGATIGIRDKRAGAVCFAAAVGATAPATAGLPFATTSTRPTPTTSLASGLPCPQVSEPGRKRVFVRAVGAGRPPSGARG